MVRKYLREKKRDHDDDLGWFASQDDFETTLRVAILSRTEDDKRHPHQRRIPQPVLAKALAKLKQADLDKCRSFEELHDRIKEKAGRIKGIGPLAVYDFACRIGGSRNLWPDFVYLHSGARTGASAINRGRGRDKIRVDELPKAFEGLAAHYVEDCLCVSKDHLKRIGDEP